MTGTGYGNEGALDWSVGTITESGATLTYYIQIEDNAAVKQTYNSNTKATLTYQNYLEHWCERDFPLPMLPYPGGSITYLFYEVNSAGNAVSRAGSTITQLADNELETIVGYANKMDQSSVAYLVDGSANLNFNTYSVDLLPEYITDSQGRTFRLIVARDRYMDMAGPAEHYDALTLGEKADIAVTGAKRVHTILLGYVYQPTGSLKVQKNVFGLDGETDVADNTEFTFTLQKKDGGGDYQPFSITTAEGAVSQWTVKEGAPKQFDNIPTGRVQGG